MNITTLEKKKKRMLELQNEIKKEEEKIEQNFGKKLINNLKISYSEIATKEEQEKLIDTIVASFNLYNENTSTEKAENHGTIH